VCHWYHDRWRYRENTIQIRWADVARSELSCRPVTLRSIRRSRRQDAGRSCRDQRYGHVRPECFYHGLRQLPDGSHASLICGDRSSDKNCAKIEPTSPEKMSPDATKCSTLGQQTTCVTQNLGTYDAERKGNELTIRAPNGKLRFRIVGSW